MEDFETKKHKPTITCHNSFRDFIEVET